MSLLKFGLLGFHVLWLFVVLPGHTRGKITWARDEGAVQVSSDGCCSVRARTAPEQPVEPTDKQKRNCAVCAYALGLTPPPVHDFAPPPLKLLDILPLPAPIVFAEQQHRLTYYACGPPDCA